MCLEIGLARYKVWMSPETTHRNTVIKGLFFEIIYTLVYNLMCINVSEGNTNKNISHKVAYAEMISV